MAATCEFTPATLNKRVTLQSLTRLSDNQGGYTESWADVKALWAKIEPAKGYEKMYGMQLRTPVTHRVLVRYRPGVTTAMRLLYGTRVLEIKEVINLEEASTYLRLMCIETT